MAPVVALIVVVDAVVSVAARWPHQFAGHGSRDHMLSDFVNSGTALAPPLIILVVFVLTSLLVRRRDRWGTVACVALGLLAVVMIVGSVGEAIAPRTPDVPRAVQFFSGVQGTLAGLLIVVLAVGSLAERRGARRSAPDPEPDGGRDTAHLA